MGIVRVFWPGQGACYECTLSDLDYQIIGLRYSCPLLARENILQGKVPTTPTSASIVAAFQTQEALKLIHGMEVQPGKAIMINGLTNDIYTTEYPVKDYCLSHSRLDPIIELPRARAKSMTLGELITIAKDELGEDVALEFDGELVVSMICPDCGEETAVYKRMARLYEQEATCPQCGAKRDMNLTHRIVGDENYLDRTLAQIDVPPLSIIRARNGKERVYYELTGDKETFLTYE
jgi:adenylyltransferase/sulfurtransferase